MVKLQEAMAKPEGQFNVWVMFLQMVNKKGFHPGNPSLLGFNYETYVPF